MSASLANPYSGSEPPVEFFVDGVALHAERGMTIAAAIEAGGRHDFSRGLKGEARGLFCGMGTCQDCLVTVDGKVSQRACMTSVKEGMQVRRPASKPAPTADHADLCDVPTAIPCLEMDVLVIGAGPAGLAAAEVAASVGASVTLVDERAIAGGQYFKQPSTSKAALRLGGDEQARSGADLIRRAQAAGVSMIGGTLVWGAENEASGPKIACYGPQGAFYCKPKMTVIATGAYERPPAIPGWTLPGVMTAGAAQTLLRSYGTVPGGRIVIAGNGPLNIQVANEIRNAGGRVVALVEIASAPWKQPLAALKLLAADKALAIGGLRQVASLRTAGIPILWENRIASIDGETGVETITVTGPGGEARLEADTVLIGGSFASSNELSRLLGCGHEVVDGDLVAITKDDGETTLAHIHVVGEAARFGGAHIAMAQGRIAGIAVARKLGFDVAPDPLAERRLARHRAFQAMLWTVFKSARPVGDKLPSDDTVICRCEGVTYGALRALGENSAKDIATLKRLSRAGMGRCQSRYCGHAIAAVAGEKRTAGETRGFLAPQMPLRPVPLAALAVEKPEWGGHKRALLPERPPLESREPLPVSQTSGQGSLVCRRPSFLPAKAKRSPYWSAPFRTRWPRAAMPAACMRSSSPSITARAPKAAGVLPRRRCRCSVILLPSGRHSRMNLAAISR
jgi:NADPH-dependent 2,4-dienoyl-CoA reductase/sulfur reductase-like enzyme